MKPYLIFFGVIILLAGLVSAGWLNSLLTIAITGGVLGGLYWLLYKSPKQSIRNTGRHIAMGIMVIASCLMVVGSITSIVSLALPPKTTKCKQCATSGGYCRACGNFGEITYSDDTIFSISTLVAGSGVALFFGAKKMREDAPKTIAPATSSTITPNYALYSFTANNVPHLETPSAQWFFSHGHYQYNGAEKEWARYKPDFDGSWDVRCFVVYKNPKEVTCCRFVIAPYDSNQRPLAIAKTLSVSSCSMTSDATSHTLHWHNLWNDMPIQYLQVSSIELTYRNGTTETFNF